MTYNLNGLHSIVQALLIQYQDNQVIKRRQNLERDDMGTNHNLYSFSLKIIHMQLMQIDLRMKHRNHSIFMYS